MTYLLTITPIISLLILHNTSAITNSSDVLNLPFMALYNVPKKLHLVTDQFLLTQTVNLKPMIVNLEDIKKGFLEIKQHYHSLNDSQTTESVDIENKLVFILENVATTIEAGLQLIPHSDTCWDRSKRSVVMDVHRYKRLVDLDRDTEVVNTHALFPALGNMFSWVTGTLSARAGEVINENYNNIRRLSKMSLRFASMINATLSIEKKHARQMSTLSGEIHNIKIKLQNEMDKLERKVNYNTFLQNLVMIALDLQRTIDSIFEHTDRAETNQMGSFSRDPIFLSTIQNLLDYKVKKKKNSLYLMKLASKIEVEACHWAILITYKFPVLESTDYDPKRVLSMPKEIKGKFFELETIPHVITWASRVYSFTKAEFDNCDTFNSHVFCRVPSHTENLLDNCIYGITHNVQWKILAKKCPMVYVKVPQEFVKVTTHSMIYFFLTPRYATVICETYSKPLTLTGAGFISIPTGCRVKYGSSITYSLGHIARSGNVLLDIDDKIWHANFSSVLPLLTIKNVQNLTSLLLDTSAEEDMIEEGLEDVMTILNYMEFSPKGVMFTLWSLIGYTMVATIMLLGLLYCICVPGSVLGCKRCCCCMPKRPRA